MAHVTGRALGGTAAAVVGDSDDSGTPVFALTFAKIRVTQLDGSGPVQKVQPAAHGRQMRSEVWVQTEDKYDPTGHHEPEQG